jgi:hypothetical protein
VRRLEPLSKSHDRDGFGCGSEPLKDHNAKAFYEHFGFVPLPSNELELFLPAATIQEALTQEG